MTISAETLQKLAKYDTPTICNAIELFNIRSRTAGYMNQSIHSNFPEMPPMVGFACTAAFRSAMAPSGGAAYGSLEKQIELYEQLPGPAVMVFEDMDEPTVAATFGEVMCSTYRGFGSVGLITSGGGRDLEQVRELDYPVFTGSTICSHGYCQILHLAMPVHVGGLVVETGDLLHGDANGVTNIPIEIADEVGDVAEDFIKAERIILDYVQGSGEKKLQEFLSRQAEYKEVMAKVESRVRR